MADEAISLDQELAGIDALDAPLAARRSRRSRRSELVPAVWPKLVAGTVIVGTWQAVVSAGWKDPWQLPPPSAVFARLSTDIAEGTLLSAAAVTMTRAVAGYALACVLGIGVGLVVSWAPALRAAVGSLITGVQTMPSIAWFPFAILLFQLTEQAILVVVVLGAAPSIANGLIDGVDRVPPDLIRAGRVLGARGVEAYRHVIMPAAFPATVAGLKQGWAFAWRSLMAGELLVIIATRPSLGTRLQFAREFNDAPALLASMIVVLVIGVAVDAVLFGRIEQWIRARWGLLGSER